jgi:hypothetical protein
MTFGAAWLIWSNMMNFFAGVHVDGERLRSAARGAGVPEIVMEGIAAFETGYPEGNGFLGKAGEVGRMHFKVSTARFVGCREPVNLEITSTTLPAERVLRFCRDIYQGWPLAIRCYQGMAVPESTKDYLLKAEREIGRLILARLDQEALEPPATVATVTRAPSVPGRAKAAVIPKTASAAPPPLTADST